MQTQQKVKKEVPASQIDNDPARMNSQEKPQFIKTRQSAVFLKATSGVRPTTTFHEEGH